MTQTGGQNVNLYDGYIMQESPEFLTSVTLSADLSTILLNHVDAFLHLLLSAEELKLISMETRDSFYTMTGVCEGSA